MKENKRLDAEDGPKMLTGALSLILTGDAGPIMARLADVPGMTFTYHITPLNTPDSYNWRLITAPT